MNPCDKPVGIFDSGLGGLSVLREMRLQLPGEDYIYFGDRKNAPYGDRSNQEILSMATAVAKRLVAQDIKALVVACNTASSVAVECLRASLAPLPVICIEPAVRPACQLLTAPGAPQDAAAVVMATSAMLASPRMQSRLSELGMAHRFLLLPCPGLVDLVETGDFSAPALHSYLREKLSPLRTSRVHAAVLGCTHYVLARPAMEQACREIFGIPSERILDGNAGTTQQLKRVLFARGLLRDTDRPGELRIYASADQEGARRLAERVLGVSIAPAGELGE